MQKDIKFSYCCLCKRKDFDLPYMQKICDNMKEDKRIQLKTWELCSIYKALHERDCIGHGKTGLGFGVGTEPLPALFAKYGCKIVATDLPPDDPRRAYWKSLGFKEKHHPVPFKKNLNVKNICDPVKFDKNVDVQYVDMNYIYESLNNKFDFTWSTSSFEHIGGINNSLAFFRTQMKCLKVGGWAVHATAYNISSNEETYDAHNMCFFRKKDLERLARDLKEDGNYMEPFDFSTGKEPDDLIEASYPYGEPMIRVRMKGYLITSVILIAQRRR